MKRAQIPLLLVVAFLLGLATRPAASSGAPLRGDSILCTPDSVLFPNGEQRQTAHPIVEALNAARPGSLIRVERGTYSPFTIGFDSNAPNNVRSSGGEPGFPVIVEGLGRVRIRSGSADTIAIDQRIRNGHITFRNFDIEGSPRAAVMFYRQPGFKPHVGYTFEDCNILGGYDHRLRTGKHSKWGVWAHSLKDFRFAGALMQARVENICTEHGFYIQNPQGDITIENVLAKHLGRTFCQFTARAAEGAAGKGTIRVRNCDVRDVGLSAMDGYKGGAAFTIAGRLPGSIIIEGNRYQAGFDATVTKLTRRGQPYGTGALVAWDGGEKVKNGKLILRDNDFRFAEGCGDRPVVAIGGTREVHIVGSNRFVSGGQFAALALDPVDDAMKLRSKPNGSAYMAPTTELEGELTVRGKTPGPQVLQRLSQPR